MSIVALQDSIVKTSLVQHTQTHNDNVVRGQEIGMAAQLKEQERQTDQVVLQSREAEQEGIRDEEKNKDGKKKKQQNQNDDENRDRDNGEEEEDQSPRARMRQINIVI